MKTRPFLQDELLKKKYKGKEDPELHKKYCEGNNDIPYVWIAHRYCNALFTLARSRVRDDARAQDVLAELMKDLVLYPVRNRADKLPLIDNSVAKSLFTKVKFKAIDIFRKDSKTGSFTEKNEKQQRETKSDDDFLRRFEFEDFMSLFKEKLNHEKYADIDIPFLEKWLLIGSGNRALLAEQTGLTLKETTKVIRRIKIKGVSIYNQLKKEEEV